MTFSRTVSVVAALAAGALIAVGATLPLWVMTMAAPQYPQGLRLFAYGTRMSGDVSELNILNHYIGMPPLEAPAFETAVFPYGIGVIVVLCLLSPLHTMFRRLAIAAAALAPIAVLVDLQYRLYVFGHTLNPKAPIRLKPFTPLVLGQTTMGNFVSSGMVATGFWCLLGGCLLLTAAPYLARRRDRQQRGATVKRGTATAAAASLVLLMAAAPEALPDLQLQSRIDAAPKGTTVVVPAGVYRGPVVIRGALAVVAEPGAVIDGGGTGSVVTIEGRGVTLRGFTIRNSGRNVTEEAAGITMSGDGHRVEANRIEDVYFGIHLNGGAGSMVVNNVIEPGVAHGARPGHGVSAWHLTDSEISGNRIAQARDGIYLSFTTRVVVTGNSVTGCRYGLHSMYSADARFERNEVVANLLGAALMNSDRLVFRGNRIQRHRQGPAAYGVLLKDIGDLIADGNLILSNRIGIYAEGVPSDPDREAVLTRNVVAGNDVGFALQSTAALTVAENRIAENLTDVRALGRQLSPGMRWSRDRRGNSWGQYRGFDANHDGLGDVPYRVEEAMDALVRRNDSIQAFLYTPAHLAVETAARMFPLFRQPPVLIDEFPLMTFRDGASR